jgi:hypothetical protein
LLWKLLNDWNILSTGRLAALQAFESSAPPFFLKAEKPESFFKPRGEALLPLKKGGREGFLEELSGR